MYFDIICYIVGGGGGSTTQFVDCPKPIVGRIIGKGGETINQLQQRSGTKMQVDQTSMPQGTTEQHYSSVAV